MNKEEFKECSVVAYPRQIKFLHINGGAISYYVDRHVSDYVDRLQQENQELKEKIKTYEDPEDLTLMFMYCDEKAKDKIRELKKQLEDKEERLERLRISAIGHAERELDLENQQKEFIEYLENEIKIYSNTYMEEMLKELKEILSKYKEIIGGKDEDNKQ